MADEAKSIDEGDDLARRFVRMCASVWIRKGGAPEAFEAACLAYAINQHVEAIGEDQAADFLEGVSDLIRPPRGV